MNIIISIISLTMNSLYSTPYKLIASEGCFLTVLSKISGFAAGLVACCFKLGRVPVPMFAESAFKAIYRECVNHCI